MITFPSLSRMSPYMLYTNSPCSLPAQSSLRSKTTELFGGVCPLGGRSTAGHFRVVCTEKLDNPTLRRGPWRKDVVPEA